MLPCLYRAKLVDRITSVGEVSEMLACVVWQLAWLWVKPVDRLPALGKADKRVACYG